jgi:hypothetical protein
MNSKNKTLITTISVSIDTISSFIAYPYQEHEVLDSSDIKRNFKNFRIQEQYRTNNCFNVNSTRW